MKKLKIFIIIGVTILVTAAIVIVLVLNRDNNQDNKDSVNMANSIYGKSYCEYNGNHPTKKTEIYFVIAPTYKCKLCGEECIIKEGYYYLNPQLCKDCAKSTHRCEYCGHLLAENK